jgi:hypothetical protein
LLSESDNSTEKVGVLKPPSRRSSWYDRFFEILSSRKLDSVDIDFVKTNITPDRGDASRFIRGLKFLDLIDENSKATKELDKLRLTGEQFTKNLGAIVKNAYAPVFSKVVLETVKRDNLVNFFIDTYDLPGNVANDAVELFVYFANKSAIQISPDLSTTLQTMKTPRESVPRRNSAPSRESSQSPVSNLIPDNVEELRLGAVRIWLPKGDKTAANTAKQLIDLYLSQLP